MFKTDIKHRNMVYIMINQFNNAFINLVAVKRNLRYFSSLANISFVVKAVQLV